MPTREALDRANADEVIFADAEEFSVLGMCPCLTIVTHGEKRG